MMSVIEVVSYNPQWPQMFKDEAAIIKQVLGDECLAIHHIGSTAVPGLRAKPIIDIIVVTKDHTPCIEPLRSISYEYKGEYNLPFRQYFSKDGCVKFHIHAYTEGHTEIDLNLLFTQYLIAHPDVRQDYGLLKANLIQQQQSHEKNNSAFSGYTLGKYQFIQQTLQQAGFDKKKDAALYASA